MSFNEHFFRRAIELAESARGRTGTNPFVGAVLVKNGIIVGEGQTQQCGGNHAEIEALLAAGTDAEGADLYVTLEPCCHHGKTPPCTRAIIEAGIRRVFAGIEDPNPNVQGYGFKQLKEANIEVKTGFQQEGITRQLEGYLTNQTKKRPFIVMKNAVSLDGKIATNSGASKWISSPESRMIVHKLRQNTGTVLTGIDTVLCDDPLLNIRFGDADKLDHSAYLRVILDRRLRIPLESKIVATSQDIPTILFKSHSYKDTSKEKQLLRGKIEILSVPENKQGYLSLLSVVEELYNRGITNVLLEAGCKLNSSFLRDQLIDKVYYFMAPKFLGGQKTVIDNIGITNPSEALKMRIDKIENIGPDILIIGYPEYHIK